MSTTIRSFQIYQRAGEDDFILIHPETKAERVLVNNEGLTATNVAEAIAELDKLIDDIVSGGVVTGVKGNAETSFRKGAVNITATNLGLGNVNNTSDINKPVSTAQQAALDLKEDKANLGALAYKDGLNNGEIGLGNVTNDAQVKRSEMGVPSGVATLDSGGKVPVSQLPGYVSDIYEYATLAGFPSAGESNKLYLDKSTGKLYRWAGSVYAVVSDTIALGETSSTAYPGDKGKANADAITALQNRATSIELVNDSQDTAILAAQAQADKGVSDAATAQSTANTANSKAITNATAIEQIVNGTTYVGNATNAKNAESATSANKLATARTIEFTGDVSGSMTFDGSANRSVDIELANSGVTAGTYSAVVINKKGIATAGSQILEIGTESQTTPSANLAIGGLFFKRL